MKWPLNSMGIITSGRPHQENLSELMVKLDGASDRCRKLIKRPREMRNTKSGLQTAHLHNNKQYFSKDLGSGI